MSSPLAAQQSSRTLPLSIPTEWRLTCHAVTDSLGSGYEFSFGQPIDTVTRRLEARFDSSGRPLRLAETLLIDVPQDSVWSYSTGARFISRDSVVGVRNLRVESWEQAARGEVIPGRLRPLTAEERGAVKALTAWIWAHRCPGAASR